ncbi:MAG: hypothetical protein V4651_05415 [Bacteroidota bacterium]
MARSGQTVTLGSNLAVSGGALNITGGNLAIGNNTLTIDGPFTCDEVNSLVANGSTSTLNFTNTGNATVYFDQSNYSVSNQLGTLNFNRSGSTLTLGNHVYVASAVNLTAGKLAIGNNAGLIINGTINHNATNCIVGGSNTNLQVAGSGGNVSLYLDQTTPGTTNQIGTLSINRIGTTTSMTSDLVVGNGLNLINGKLAIGSNTLSINGSVASTIVNCVESNGSSSLNIGGSGALTFPVFDQTTSGTTNCLNNLSFNRNGTITINNSLLIKGTVTPTAGTLNTNGYLTLISNASGTARIASGGCTSCSYISGNVIAQRYIPAVARRWRFAGSQIQSGTLADWQNEMYITGSGGVANGFDATSSNAPSVYWYNETITTGNLNTGWVAATNISNSLNPGRGYRVFIRGDRSDIGRLNSTNNTQNAVTLDLVGTPNQGDITMPVTFSSSGVLSDDGWNFVSNPYASPYDWNAHYDNGTFHSNINSTIFVLSAQTGGYTSYNASSNTGTLTNGIIPPGAGFWVKANAAAPSLTFKEQFKVGTNPLGIFKTNTDNVFNVKITLDSITSDELLVKYDAASSINADSLDITKLAGIVNISSYANDNVHLSLTVRPASLTIDTIKLSVSGEVGNYNLYFSNIEELMLTPTSQLFLIDTYLSTVTDLKVTHQYPFSILSGITASQGSTRFYILINNGASLPVSLINFDATLTPNKEVALSWTVAQEINCDQYLIQRSTNNQSYETIGTIKGGIDQTHNLIKYSYIDTKPNSQNYYRLKQVDLDGSFTYSPVKFIQLDNVSQHTVLVYPTLIDRTITMKRTATEFDNCIITLTDLNGIPVKTYTNPQWINNMINLDLSDLPQGFYILNLNQDGDEQTEEFKLIKQ